MRKACPEAAAVARLVGYFDEQIHVKNGNLDANSPYVLGVDEYYPNATAYGVALGRFFTPAESGAQRVRSPCSAPTSATRSFQRSIPSGKTSA